MKKVLVLLMVFVAAMAFSGPAYGAKGAIIDLGLGSGMLSGDEAFEDAESGLAYDLNIGYNFTDNLGAYLYWGAAAGEIDINNIGIYEVDTAIWAVGWIGIGGRYYYDFGDKLSAYGGIGIGQYLAQIEIELDGDDIEEESDPEVGYMLNGGLNYYFTNNLFLGGELAYHSVDFEDGNSDLLTLEAQLGYHFK